MRQFLLLFLAWFISVTLSAQSVNPCGTVTYRSTWLQKYQADPAVYPKNDSLLVVPLTLHLVGQNDGTGYFSELELVQALCFLNEVFADLDIQFYRKGDFNYIDNSAYYNHASVLDGAEMMFANNVDSTLNVYFVSDPAGNCGYNLPYAGIAMGHNCSTAGSYTLAHEIGHALRLPHPFLGWEGGISYDGSVPPDFSQPAPEQVTYDYTFFQDTLSLDTLIIDTAWVEKVDQSNCTFAADGFCDTNPDYLASRWSCDALDLSLETQTDPDGATFQSDGSLIMGYSRDNCASRFTPEQMAAMRANLMDEKAHWLANADPLPDPLSDASPLLTYPLDGDLPSPNVVTFSWEPVANASHYFLEVSRFASFTESSTIVIETTEPTADVFDLEEDKRYYWRVRAYNNGYYCGTVSDDERFETGFAVTVTDPTDGHEVRFHPNPAAIGSPVLMDITVLQATHLTLRIQNAIGQELYIDQRLYAAGTHRAALDIALPGGVYWITLQNGVSTSSYRIVVQ